jgi:hypothetical protein
MSDGGRDKLLSSLLWAAVAVCGQYTALFFTVIGRIHVSFVNSAPAFTVDPRGSIVLTKDMALQAVWALTVVFGLVVFWVVYRRPRPTLRAWRASGALGLGLAVVAGLAEPWWTVVLVGDAVLLAAAIWLGRRS